MPSADRVPDFNPFVFSRPLAPREAIGRDADVARLVARAEGGHNVTLHAPRRWGKTSLLKQTLEAAQNAGMVAVSVDLSDVLSAGDVAARLDFGYRALRGPLSRFVADHLSGVGVTLPFGSLDVQRRAGADDPLAAVHALLELPRRIAERSERRVLVALDEFQALVDLPGMDGVFRSHLQHHGDVASYLFAGSEPSLLRALFEDRARPLYGQAELVRLGRLEPEDARPYVARRFAETGRDAGEALMPLVLVAEGHPQRLMLLAHHLWDATPPGATADLRVLRMAHEAAMRAVDAELRRTWDALSANERRVLLAVASDLAPLGADALRLTGLRSKSSAQRALGNLVAAAVVERGDGDPAFTDPLFARWVRRNAGARLTVFVVPDPARRGYVVTDGPSLAFAQGRHDDVDDAERAAQRILGGRIGTVRVFAGEDPNELPEWAVAG